MAVYFLRFNRVLSRFAGAVSRRLFGRASQGYLTETIRLEPIPYRTFIFGQGMPNILNSRIISGARNFDLPYEMLRVFAGIFTCQCRFRWRKESGGL